MLITDTNSTELVKIYRAPNDNMGCVFVQEIERKIGRNMSPN